MENIGYRLEIVSQMVDKYQQRTSNKSAIELLPRKYEEFKMICQFQTDILCWIK